jgi:DHA1 family multidrug resistance protein-like MFS transporter
LPATDSWKKNLYVMFVAEFVVITGFSFIMPFMPLFVQQLGSFTEGEASLWSGIAMGVSSIALFLSGPFWGLISDKWGRKPMVLRALFGSAVIQTLAALSPNIYIFVALRFLQGLFSGTVPAASALVASGTPREKVPYAMGLVMVGVFCGNTIGPSIGGVLASVFGYRDSFFIASAMMVLAGFLVLFLVQEDFQRPVKENKMADVWKLLSSKALWPLLLTICAIALSQNVVQPIIALFIQQLNPSGNASASSGFAFTALGLMAAIASVVVGRWNKRFELRTVLAVSCLGGVLIYLAPTFIYTVPLLIVFIGLMGIFQGTNVTCTSSLVSYSLPVEQQGIAYGLAQSATSLGNGLGPILGGTLGTLLGLRWVFVVASGFFLVAGILVTRFIRRQPGFSSEPNIAAKG